MMAGLSDGDQIREADGLPRLWAREQGKIWGIREDRSSEEH